MSLSRKKKISIIVFIAIVLISLGSYYFLNGSKDYVDISYTDFLNKVETNEVQKVFLSDNEEIRGILKDGQYFITDNPRTEGFKEKLLMEDIIVKESSGNTTVKDMFTFVFIIGAFGGIAFFMNKNSAKSAEKEMTKMSSIESEGNDSSKITFEEIAGNQEAKENLRELVDFIKNPGKYEKYGARMPRGVMLYGPPGTGKTLLAKALAGEANVPYFAVTGSDFIQVYAGLGASRIRDLFKRAREAGKCVIFIDEIDALGKKRKGALASGGNDESDRTLNALLTEMSGFKGNEGIIVIAATNRIDTLDDALLRPGRFDRQIEVGLPDVNARYKILKLYSRNKPVARDVDLYQVAYQTVYFSGAKLESLMNESAMLAAKENEKNITMKHIDKAFYTVIAGEEKKDISVISLEEKNITAYHEAGHALVTKLVSPQNRVTKITIIPSTKGAGGFSMNIPPDKMYRTKEEIKNTIMTALGGRASEEIVFGKDKITTGASNDLQKATDMALAMISRFGMDDETGLVSYDVLTSYNITSNIEIVQRVKSLLKELYDDTKRIIEDNKQLLDKLTERLLKKETINERELNEIVNLGITQSLNKIN